MAGAARRAAPCRAHLPLPLDALTGEKVLPQGSGRTDAGVHALAQVVTFVTESSVPTENFLKALNDILPASVRVLAGCRDACRIPCAAFRAWQKRIGIESTAARSVRHFWRATYGTILIRSMRRRCAGLPSSGHGGKRFHFVCRGRSRARARGRARVERADDFFLVVGTADDELIYTVRGSGFLHHMVRNLVGTFILVGRGTLRTEDITGIIDARSRSAAGATAPASGLYLVEVEYSEMS